jgi:hypothetical protein
LKSSSNGVNGGELSGKAAVGAAGDGFGGLGGGGVTFTIPPHFGQATVLPARPGLAIFNRA